MVSEFERQIILASGLEWCSLCNRYCDEIFHINNDTCRTCYFDHGRDNNDRPFRASNR